MVDVAGKWPQLDRLVKVGKLRRILMWRIGVGGGYFGILIGVS